MFFVTGDEETSPVFEFRDVHIPIITSAGMVYYFFSHLEMLILVTAGLTKSDGTATEKVLPDTNNKNCSSFLNKEELPNGVRS